MRQKARLKSGPIQYWILNVDSAVCKLKKKDVFKIWARYSVLASAFANTSETIIASAVQ